MTQLEEQAILLTQICTDSAIQPRLERNRRWIKALAQAMHQGRELPPVVCFYDGYNYWLADGLDRLEAAKLAEQKAILADIRQGSLQEAISYSRFGSQRNKDKRQVVDRFLGLLESMSEEEKEYWSHQNIGTYCCVTSAYVGQRRQNLGYTQPSKQVVKLSDGNSYHRDISKIQQNRKSTSQANGFDWTAIDDKQFEKLVFAIVRAHYPVEIESRSGTGGQGRDLQAKFISKGNLGEHLEEIYFIEAKHHQSAVRPQHIAGALTWAQAEQPSALVIAVSNEFTNAVKTTHIPKWKTNNPKVRVILWERGEIEEFIKYQLSTRELAISLNLVSKSWFDQQLTKLSKQVLEEYQSLFIEFLQKIKNRFGISVDKNEISSKLKEYGFSALTQHHLGKSCEEPEVGSVMVTAFTRILNDIERQKNI